MENPVIIMAKEGIIKEIMALEGFDLMRFVKEHKLDGYDTMELVRQAHNELLSWDMKILKKYKMNLLHKSFDLEGYMEEQKRYYYEAEEEKKRDLYHNQSE